MITDEGMHVHITHLYCLYYARKRCVPYLHLQLVTGFDTLTNAMDGVLTVFEATKDTIQTVAHILIPPPGGMVMVAVFELASFAIKAMYNSELCRALAQECAGLMRTMLIYSADLREKKDFQLLLDEFDSAVKDVTQVVKEHAGGCV